MKAILKIIIMLVSMVMVSSCVTTTSYEVPQKYMLDDQLERVDRVPDVRVGRSQPAFTTFEESFEDPQKVMARRDTVTFSETSNQWVKIDAQSFALRSGPGEYYLLVLNLPAIDLMSTESISFTLLSNIIKAKSDYLELNGSRYIIERIYKIESTQKLLELKYSLTKPTAE